MKNVKQEAIQHCSDSIWFYNEYRTAALKMNKNTTPP